MSNVFFTSDHHFGHKLIIDFESRPFSSAEEMDRVMAEKWNSVVGKEDTVFHLGDFSFLKLDSTRQIVSALNGYKILILGNHDRSRGRSWWLEAGFDEVSEYPLVYKDFFFLSHEPMYMNRHMPYINVHGHIHGQKYEGKNHFNICVEHWDYMPLAFTQIRDLVAADEEG
ncbi:metallophosphoesterase [Paenibacillus sp. S150]|uniref:metallophosphoesterase n=1 Tax=Paenibacillus sp. S150 TaxID=2749826 RepID=UPI001C55D329|nr:metallophosphoesterase [Paenibacillus sp. S150]MBW4083227.1 metallophosphoesterase [Paenibacillus sp. S150]